MAQVTENRCLLCRP